MFSGLRLKVKLNILLSVNYPIGVKALDGQEHVGCVELGGLFLEPSDLGDVEKEFSAGAVVHDKEQLFVSLKCAVKMNNEWVADPLQDFAFSPSVLDLLLLSKLLLLEHLHGVEHSISLLFHQQNFSIGPCPDYLNQRKVILANLSRSCLTLFY